MDQQYICTVCCPLMLEIVQSQACDTIYMNSELNPEIIYITENTIHYKHCLI